jgi:hypothetical protein
VQGLRRLTCIAAEEQKVSTCLTSGFEKWSQCSATNLAHRHGPRRPSPRGIASAETQERACYLRAALLSFGQVGRLARSRSSKPPCSGGGSETFFMAAEGYLAAEVGNSPYRRSDKEARSPTPAKDLFDVLLLRHRSIGRQWSSAKIDAEPFAPH